MLATSQSVCSWVDSNVLNAIRSSMGEWLSRKAGLVSDVAVEEHGALGLDENVGGVQARGDWEGVWKRFKKDKLALAAGVFTILLRGDLSALASIQFNRGDLLLAGALVAFGLYSALMPRRPVTHQLSLIAVTTAGGALLLLPFSIWEYSNGFRLQPDMITLVSVIYVVIFPSSLAYLCFNRGIALIGPNRAAPFFHLMPVFGSAMAIALLGEQPRLYHLVGYVMVLAGVVIASRRGSAK